MKKLLQITYVVTIVCVVYFSTLQGAVIKIVHFRSVSVMVKKILLYEILYVLVDVT